MQQILVSAPGKIHLSGEHSVVYGEPALLAAINKRLFISLKQGKNNLLKIRSEIPIGAGLGSSAALAVALTSAVILAETKRFNLEEINQLAYEMERKQHGHPSGGDNTIATYGGLLKFQKINENFKFEQIKLCKGPAFTLVDSGKPKENTREMVAAVAAKYQIASIKYQAIFKKIGRVTQRMIALFKADKFEFENLKDLIRENERLLEELGVVGEKARKIIRLIEKNGGVAKICGAGGMKQGSGMLLAYYSQLGQLKNVLNKNKIKFMEVKLADEGVRIERS